jgi:RNA polymerase sigma-70 factor (ECF subfamily)
VATTGDASAQRAQEAYLELVRDYQSAILNYVYRLVGDVDLAEDLTQDCFLKAYRSLNRLELEPEAADRRRAWLYRIATNVAIDHLRRAARLRWLPLSALDGAGWAHDDPTSAVVEAQGVQMVLQSLSPDQRAVLLLFNQVGLSADEVAATLGITPEAARKRRQRAKEAFLKAWNRRAGLEGND